MPQGQDKRDAYAHLVGEDGFALLDALAAPETPEALRALPSVATLRRTWQRHYERASGAATAPGHRGGASVRFRPNRALPPAAEGVESPYDPEARYRHKRDTQWTGSMVHVSETCEPTTPHLITHVHTTTAVVHEAQCTALIQAALVAKGLPPSDHLVDAASISGALLVRSREDHGITLRDPTRPNQSWQAQVEGGYRLEDFTVDWEQQQVRCPQGKISVRWLESTASARGPYVHVRFGPHDCGPCATRTCCTRATQHPRAVQLQPRAQYEALEAARTWYASEAGQQCDQQRAGVEGTLLQGVRAFGLRQTRYRGLAKTHFQHVATAAAINVDRLVAWLEERPQATTRTSRFAALAPISTLPAGTPAV